MIYLNTWWDAPASGIFSERGAFILAKFKAHDAATLDDVLVDLYRDAVPHPMAHDASKAERFRLGD